MAETEIANIDRDGDFQLTEIIPSGDSSNFPSRAVKDLLSHGVCGRCILRLFGHRGDLYSHSRLSSSILSSVCEGLADSENHKIDDTSEEKITYSDNLYCSLCLGILQFSYCDDKGSLVGKGSACDFAASVVDLIKKEGHEIDEFSLEMSIPSVIQENELSVCSYMKNKYSSDPWFVSKELPQCVSVKEALKSSMTGHLQKMVDCKSTTSSLCIRLTYSHPQASTTIKTVIEENQECKRRKTVVVTVNGLETDGSTVKCDDFSTKEIGVVVESSSVNHQDCHFFNQPKFPLEQVFKPCQFVFQCNRTNIYFGGRYLKFSRNVSQTRWIIDDERMGDASVEELIGSIILPVCRGDNYKFHAAGREDIDVRMLGSGRPFLIEVHNARRVPIQEDLKNMEKRVNDSENKLVGIKNLKIVGSQGWTMMREGESEKQKQYAAVVWISRPLQDADFQSISSYREMSVLQKTPIRVLHRRSPLEREKIIHWMRMEKISGSSQYFLLHLCTQAGTYIKEFVHGDLGRTHPSIGSILGCRAEILQLDVTDVKMDCFLDKE